MLPAPIFVKSENTVFIFQFSFSRYEPLPVPSTSPPESPLVVPYSSSRYLPYVECLISREDVPDIFFHWAGPLNANPALNTPPQSFELSYDDTNDCKGEFKFYLNSMTGKGFVWFDLSFGYGLFGGNFTGDMIQIPDPDVHPDS